MPRQRRSDSSPAPHAVTVVDVAKAVGVSAMTVSRALAGNGHVSEETRLRVQEAADKLNLAGKLATEHLIRLGHRAIAHIGGRHIRPARLRQEGYLAALKEHGLKVRDSFIVTGGFCMPESREAARFLMCLTERPTGIVAGNDNSAFGAVRGCREAGFRVPENVSVVGIGNVEGDQHPSPFLTTIHWDRTEMGREAARILIAQLSGKPLHPPAREVFAPSLLIRQSAVAPAAHQ